MIKELGSDCSKPFDGGLTKQSLAEAHKPDLKVVAWGWPEMKGSEFNAGNITKLID